MRATELKAGEEAAVCGLLAAEPLLSQLLARGLCPGTRVRLLFCGPLGSPLALLVRGTVLALSRDAAALVLLSRDSGAALWYDGENAMEAAGGGGESAGAAPVGSGEGRGGAAGGGGGAGRAYHPL